MNMLRTVEIVVARKKLAQLSRANNWRRSADNPLPEAPQDEGEQSPEFSYL